MKQSEIWQLSRGEYALYTEDETIWQRIKTWSDAHIMARYYDSKLKGKPFGKLVAIQFIFPKRLLNKAREAIGLERLQKDPAAVSRGKLLGEKYKSKLRSPGFAKRHDFEKISRQKNGENAPSPKNAELVGQSVGESDGRPQ